MGFFFFALAAIAVIMFGVVAVAYFRYRGRGKSYVAVSAFSAIIAIWAGVVSLFAVNWPQVGLALFLRHDPSAILTAAQPSWTVIGASVVLAIVANVTIAKIAHRALQSDQFPLNASAREIEEPGRSVSLSELVWAHARYKFSNKPDRTLGNPGQDPYKLPDVSQHVDWSVLSADLLYQIEPNIFRDSFKYIEEKVFYLLSGSDPFRERENFTWVVWPAPYGATVADAENAFHAARTKNFPAKGNITYIACLRTTDHIDQDLEIDGRRLRILSQGALLRRTLDFSGYAASLIQRFEVRSVPGTSYSLMDCFVPPRVRPVRSAGALIEDADEFSAPERDLLDLLSDWSKRSGVDHISIIGEFGQGKSTALLAYCAQWARRWAAGQADGDRIPLLIELRGKSPRRQSPDRFLAEWGDRYGLRGEALWNLVQSGNVVLIFEGFDEVQDAGLRYDRFEQFKALWAFSRPDVKIVFTGRPNFFLDTHEREKLLRSNRAAADAGLANSEIFSLSFLEEQGIRSVLSGYPDKDIEEIIAHCREDPTFFDIAKRPSMLPVIGNRWDIIKKELQSQDGITSSSIVGYFIDFLYARKEADQDNLGEYKLLNRAVRHFLTQRVAWRMAKQGLRNTIDNDTFVSAIEEGYHALDAEFRMTNGGQTEVTDSISVLQERLKGRPFSEIIAIISTDVRTNGLLAPDPAGGASNLYFPHKQYFEYILGEVISANLDPDRHGPWAKSLTEQEVMSIAQSEPVSIFFASGIIPRDIVSSGPKQKLAGRVLRGSLNAYATYDIHGSIMMSFVPFFGSSSTELAKIAIRLPLSLRGLYYTSRNVGTGLKNRRMIYMLGLLTGGVTVLLLYVSRAIDNVAGGGDVPAVIRLMAPIAVVLLTTIQMYSLLAWRIQSNEALFLLMEIYRNREVRSVRSRHGEVANAAVILLLALRLPRGAVRIPKDVINEATSTLQIRTVHPDGEAQRR